MANIDFDTYRRFQFMERWLRQTPEQMLRTPNHPSSGGNLFFDNHHRNDALTYMTRDLFADTARVEDCSFNSQSNVIGGYMTRDLYTYPYLEEVPSHISEDLLETMERFREFDKVWNYGKSVPERLEPTRTIQIEKILKEYE